MRQAAVDSPEFLLHLSCCRWNFASEPDFRPELPSAIDWPRFVALARFHRVQGLAWNALAQQAEQLPPAAQEMLSSDARSIAATNLATAAECGELERTFRDAEVALLFVKGLTVSALAYRSPLLKMGWDIDLLIDPRDLAAAAELLLERGYRVGLPANLANLRSWHRRSKESVWHKADSFHVELHIRLADNHQLIPTISAQSSRQLVEVAPATVLPTLAEEELVAYLAVHGASSAWFRLKWISDFAGLLAGKSGEEIEQLYRRSQDLGAARAAGQALLLADRLFDTLRAAPALRAELSGDRAAALLSRAALKMMTKGIEEPTERPLGTLAIHWTQFLLRPGMGYKVSELARQGATLLMR